MSLGRGSNSSASLSEEETMPFIPLFQFGAAIGAAILLGDNYLHQIGIFLAIWAIMPVTSFRK
jgi:hypothetical protein